MYCSKCNEYIPSGVSLNACPSCGVDLNVIVTTTTKRSKEGYASNQAAGAEKDQQKSVRSQGLHKGAFIGIGCFLTAALVSVGYGLYISGTLPFFKKDEKKIFTLLNIERRSGTDSAVQEPKGDSMRLIPFEPQMMDSPFRILYPEKWRAREDYLGRGHARLYLTRDPVPEGKVSFRVGLGIDVAPGFFARRTDNWENQKSELIETLREMGADILANSDIKITGRDGVRIDFASKSVKGTVINLKIGPHLYNFTFKSPAEEYEDHKAAFEAMIESLTWLTVLRKPSSISSGQQIDVTKVMLDGKKYDVTLDGQLRKDVQVIDVIKEVIQNDGNPKTSKPSKQGE